jgi:hypothetical protein
MHESRDPDAAGVDWPGTLSFTAALVLFTWGILQAAQSGWGSGWVLSLLLGALVSLLGFIAVELRVSRPMLDLSLFRYPRFVGVQVLPIATCYCFVVLLILLPIRFIGVEGYREVDAGLMMIALSAPMVVVPFLAALLTRWISAGVVSGVGLLIAAGGLYGLSRVAPGQLPADYVLPMMLVGLGAGMPWGLMDGLSVSVVPKERAGMATGIFSTTRVAGEGIALALVIAVLAGLLQVSISEAAAGSAQIPQAAQQLANGNLQASAALLPHLSREGLLLLYANAFSQLLHLLIGITVVSALVVFVALHEPRKV